MALKKMTTYIDEDLLRSAKVYAAQSDGKIYEVINEALRRYLDDSGRGRAPLAETLAERSPGGCPECPVRTPRSCERAIRFPRR